MRESGTGQSWGAVVRRAAVSVAAAAIMVLVASRVNRPVPPGPFVSADLGVADGVLPEVRMDASSLPSLVESINSAAGKPRVRLDLAGLELGAMTVRRGVALPGRWRDVRVGDVLATGARDALNERVIDWREQDGVIVVGPPGPLECRIYDLRDFAPKPRPANRRPPIAPGGGAGLFFAPLPGPRKEPRPDEALAGLAMETLEWAAWDGADGPWTCRAWGGRLIVLTSARGHRWIETFLAELREPDPVARVNGGGGR